MAKNKDTIVKIKAKLLQISRYLGQAELYCRLKSLGLGGVTWNERQNLRKQLVQDIKNLQKEGENAKKLAKTKAKHPFLYDESEILKPGTLPYHPLACISISHCPSMGGFIFCFNTNIAIGFDIELTHRVQKSTLQRVSELDEILKTPHLPLLWAGKEAVAKCLWTKKKPLVLSDCLISKWQVLPPGGENTETKAHKAYIFEAQAKNHKDPSPIILGGAFIIEPFVVAYAQKSNVTVENSKPYE